MLVGLFLSIMSAVAVFSLAPLAGDRERAGALLDPPWPYCAPDATPPPPPATPWPPPPPGVDLPPGLDVLADALVIPVGGRCHRPGNRAGRERGAGSRQGPYHRG